MARYKPYDLNQTKMIAVSYADQVVEGSFEHALNEIVEQHLDVTVFDQRDANDATGRRAYDPRILLKVVLYGYYKGILSSRSLAEACRRNIVFMALSADTQPHFTTLASFVSELEREIVGLFRDVLRHRARAHRQGALCGRRVQVAVECVQALERHASGARREAEEARARGRAHRAAASRARWGGDRWRERAASAGRKVETYRRKVDQIKALLEQGQKKLGPTGNEQKSNITDPESAKMASSRGVIQGYNGLAVVDDRAQIVVHAEAHGSGYEAHLLTQLLASTRATLVALERDQDVFSKAKVTADSGFHSRAVVGAVEHSGVDVYIADREYRRRDPAFAGAARHKERDNEERARHRRKQREQLP